MFKEEGLLSLSQGRSGWREGTEEFLTLVEEHGKACGATGGGEEAEEGIVPYGFEAEVVEIVGRLLGHTTTTTTKRYAHLADDPLRAAADRFGSKIAGFHQ